MNNKLEVGDIVQLKSGGEEMTVKSVNFQSEGTVECVYFLKGEVKEDSFVEKTLKKITE